MEQKGKIIKVLPPSSGVSSKTGNSWMSQEYVLEVPGNYLKKMLFNIFGEERIRNANLQEGDTVTVFFDIDAHEYNGRWYNKITAYKIVQDQTIPFATAPVAAAPAAPVSEASPEPDQDDDLPF